MGKKQNYKQTFKSQDGKSFGQKLTTMGNEISYLAKKVNNHCLYHHTCLFIS